MRTADGQERVSVARAWIFGSPGVIADDRVILPDGSQPATLEVRRFPDEQGLHHDLVLFGAGR